jgi:ATP-dependent DNA ligase
MRQATRDDADTTGTTLMIFDAVPLTHFHAGESPLSQELRHAALVDMAGLLQKHGKDILYVLPKSRFNLNDPVDKEKFLAMFKQVMIDRESDPKLEGLMVKKVDAGYRCKRWAGWEKVKPYVDASLAVVGLEEGSADSKYVGMLGALVCKGVEGDRNITVKVGGGISDAERKAWWNNPELVMGMIAEIEGHEFSQDEKSEGTNNWSIRHPRLKGWRGGKPGEKM